MRKTVRTVFVALASALLALCACPAPLAAANDVVKYELRATTKNDATLHVKVSFNMMGGENALLKPFSGSLLNGGGPYQPTIELESSSPQGIQVQPLPQGQTGFSISASASGGVSVSYAVKVIEHTEGTGIVQSTWAPGYPPWAMYDALKLFRASDALLLPENASSKPLGTGYQVSVTTEGSEKVLTPWKSSSGSYVPSDANDLENNYLSWGTIARLESKSGKSDVVLGMEAKSSDKERSDYEAAAGNILSQASHIMGDRPSMPLLALSAAAPSGNVASWPPTPAMVASAVLPTSPLSGDSAVTASHSLYGLWNSWSLVPASGKEAKWFQDGSSIFYAYRLAVLAALIDKDKANSEFSKNYTGYIENPLAKTMSLADAETSSDPNAQALLVDKGAVLCSAIGQRVSDETNGGKNLDWLLNQMAKKFPGLSGKHYGVVDIEEILEEGTGRSWARFFDDYVRGTKVISTQEFSKSDTVGAGVSSSSQQLNAKGSGKSWIFLIIGMVLIMMIPVIFSGYVRRSIKLDMTMPKIFPMDDDDDGDMGG